MQNPPKNKSSVAKDTLAKETCCMWLLLDAFLLLRTYLFSCFVAPNRAALQLLLVSRITWVTLFSFFLFGCLFLNTAVDQHHCRNSEAPPPSRHA